MALLSRPVCRVAELCPFELFSYRLCGSLKGDTVTGWALAGTFLIEDTTPFKGQIRCFKERIFQPASSVILFLQRN